MQILIIGSVMASAMLASCSLPRDICELRDESEVVEWAERQILASNDHRGVRELRFEPETLRFRAIEREDQGYYVYFDASNARGEGRALQVRVHTNSCTYEVGGAPTG